MYYLKCLFLTLKMCVSISYELSSLWGARLLERNFDQDRLLVKRRNDNHLPLNFRQFCKAKRIVRLLGRICS